MNKFLKVGVIVAFGLGMGTATGVYLHWNNKAIVTSQYTYRSERLPEAFDGLRIVQISDLQSQYFGVNHRELLQSVSVEKPDLIVITGDLVDRNHTDYDCAKKAVLGLLEIAPVYYVNGNHEADIQGERIWDFYKELISLGVHVLFDKTEVLEKGTDHINISGFNSYSLQEARDAGKAEGAAISPEVIYKRLSETFEKKDDAFTMLLAHEPQFIDYYARDGVDLVFCGHAHGGQFRLPGGQGIYSPGQGVLPEYTSGMHKKSKTTMVVSRGLGNSVFPFRLNNRPEVVVVTLRK